MTAYSDVAQLLDELESNSIVDLPTITREEWRAVQDDPVFLPSGDAAAWGGLDDARRRDLVAAGQRSLLARNLLTLRAHESAEFDVDPVLQLALASRTSPEFVTAAGPQASGDPVILAYGVAATRPAVLLEFLLVDGLSKLALATPTEAAAQVAAYLVHPDTTDDLTVHKVETFRPGGSSGGRMLVSSHGTTAAMREVFADGRPGELWPTDRVALARAIESSWARSSASADR